MPKQEPEMAHTAAVAGPRLPSLGAEAAVGPPSRAYRSPLSFGTTGAAAVAPSYQDDAADADADYSGDVDSDDGIDGDADDGADGESDESQSET
jgi:hypothetical protein